MSRLGSDLVAVGCILGSAAVGGAATLALMHGGPQLDRGCAVEAMTVSPGIAVAHGGAVHTVVVRPNMRAHRVPDCVREVDRRVEIHLDGRLQELDAQLEHLDRALELQMEEMEAQIEAEVETELEARFQLEDAMKQLERARVKVVLEKAGGGRI